MMIGVGEYPGFYCYDATRPSWLPFWLDTFGESACKLKAAPGNIAACLNPLSSSCASTKETGSWINAREGTPLSIAPINPDPTVSGPGMAVEGEPTNAPTDNPLAGYFWPAMAVLGTIVIVMVLKR
jgi:hypothetical protein